MSADPHDIAKFTNDGVVLTTQNAALLAAHPESIDGGNSEIEMFFDNPAHAQVLLDERFALLSNPSPIHEGVQVSEDIGLGSVVAITPQVPCFNIVDANRGIDKVARTRAYVYEAGSDQYSVEVLE